MNEFVHVIPNNWGPFVDIFAMWSFHASTTKRVAVITPKQFQENEFADHGKQLMILWDPELCWHIARHRKPNRYFVAVYSEAFDEDTSKLLPSHERCWDRFRKELSPLADAVLCHTPWMTETVGKYLTTPTYLMPVGADPLVNGSPNWDVPKFERLVFWGSVCGRRDVLVPELTAQLGLVTKQTYGKPLTSQLDLAAGALYIAHSLVKSYSTWRLWQLSMTSCGLISEPGDTWPFLPGEHYIEIPHFDVRNVDYVCAKIKRFYADYEQAKQNLRDCAIRAHRLANHFSPPIIEKRYLGPILEKLSS